MRQKPTGRPSSSEPIVKDIKRNTRKQYGAEEKIRIVLDGLRGEDGIAELCRRSRWARQRFSGHRQRKMKIGHHSQIWQAYRRLSSLRGLGHEYMKTISPEFFD